jgi:Ca-activated chloride channel homolog
MGLRAMISRSSLRIVLLFLSSAAAAQSFGLPGSASPTFSMPYRSLQSIDVNENLWLVNGQDHSPLESPNGSLSKLDLKAPGKARREYEKGYQLLMRKDHQGALEHLITATSIYPSFVAAHNALGSAYLGLGQTEQARAEFAQAVSLDDHLPSSFLNLGCAELALKHFPAAQEAIQKASSIAPLDLQLLTALAYGQFMNHDYAGVVETARQVHDRKHDGAAMVHFFAAAAWSAQDKIPQAQHELLTLLREDPKSPAAPQAVQIIEDSKREPSRPVGSDPGLKITFTEVPGEAPTGPVQLPERIRKLLQDAKENSQIAEAEAEAGSECSGCAADEVQPPVASGSGANAVAGFTPRPKRVGTPYDGLTLRSSADEVAVFFAATDHGKSVSDLTLKDIGIQDNHKLPAGIIGLRNESKLPLRLGLIIDTSASVEGRFKFEQEAAANFLQKVVTGPDDLAFVIGFANSVLLVQDFTGDQKLMSRGLAQLVPSGGTALWDAVAFAAGKLASRPEAQPVARVLVVISDGEDNSSSATLKQAITRAQHGEVAIYTVSTREATAGSIVQNLAEDAFVGDHALITLADLTGGTAFTPGSVHSLNGSLGALQQVIRSRYLVSYKPALFKRDGQYRAIDITAEKDGHKLRIYARKGYFASVKSPTSDLF